MDLRGVLNEIITSKAFNKTELIKAMGIDPKTLASWMAGGPVRSTKLIEATDCLRESGHPAIANKVLDGWRISAGDTPGSGPVSLIMSPNWISGSLHRNPPPVARSAIDWSIKHDSLIENIYLYHSDEGAQNWVNVCNDPDTFKASSDGYWNANARMILATCAQELNVVHTRVVDFGPGDGRKDVAILDALLQDSEERIEFVAVDVNTSLLATTDNALQTRFDGDPRLTRRVALTDFVTNCGDLGAVVGEHQPTIYLLLGNTFGNLSQARDTLLRFKRLLKRGDVLILELRLQGSLDSEPSDADLHFTFGPLKLLNVTFDRDKFAWKKGAPIAAQFGAPSLTAIRYTKFRYDDKDIPSVKLLHLREYDRDAFLQDVVDPTMGFKVVGRSFGRESDGHFICALALAD